MLDNRPVFLFACVLWLCPPGSDSCVCVCARTRRAGNQIFDFLFGSLLCDVPARCDVFGQFGMADVPVFCLDGFDGCDNVFTNCPEIMPR